MAYSRCTTPHASRQHARACSITSARRRTALAITAPRAPVFRLCGSCVETLALARISHPGNVLDDNVCSCAARADATAPGSPLRSIPERNLRSPVREHESYGHCPAPSSTGNIRTQLHSKCRSLWPALPASRRWSFGSSPSARTPEPDTKHRLSGPT